MVKRENYSSLDGLRAYAAIGIVLMHVQANMAIKPSENILSGELIRKSPLDRMVVHL